MIEATITRHEGFGVVRHIRVRMSEHVYDTQPGDTLRVEVVANETAQKEG